MLNLYCFIRCGFVVKLRILVALLLMHGHFLADFDQSWHVVSLHYNKGCDDSKQSPEGKDSVFSKGSTDLSQAFRICMWLLLHWKFRSRAFFSPLGKPANRAKFFTFRNSFFLTWDKFSQDLLDCFIKWKVFVWIFSIRTSFWLL